MYKNEGIFCRLFWKPLDVHWGWSPHVGSWLSGFITVVLIPIQVSCLFCFAFLLIWMRGRPTSALKAFLKKKNQNPPNSDFHWRLLGKPSHHRCSTVYFYPRAPSLQVAVGGWHCNTGFMVSWWIPTESHKPFPVSKFPAQQSLL